MKRRDFLKATGLLGAASLIRLDKVFSKLLLARPMQNMPLSNLGRTGLKISQISLGGVAFTWLEKRKSIELVNFCLDNGINYIDTYAATGDKIGQILKERRKDFYLSTRGDSKSIDRHLRNLNVDFFDIFFISGVDSVEAYKKALEEADILQRQQRLGKFRFLGITSHNLSLFSRIIRENVFPVVMFPCNCLAGLSTRIFKAAAKNKVGIIAMKPLAGGNLTNYGASLRFVLNTPVSTALVGTKNVNEVKQNIGVLKDTTITEKDRAYYKQIRRELGKEFCRYCGHCIFPDPCPVGIPIRRIMMLKTLAYQSNMRKTVSDETLSKVKDCIKCGICEERCPYKLPIRDLLPKKVDEYLKITSSKNV